MPCAINCILPKAELFIAWLFDAVVIACSFSLAIAFVVFTIDTMDVVVDCD